MGYKEMKYERYEHHGKIVWVREDLKGTHRNHCLCHSCKNFHPDTQENCKIAQENFELCKKYNITTPVFECPLFDHL